MRWWPCRHGLWRTGASEEADEVTTAPVQDTLLQAAPITDRGVAELRSRVGQRLRARQFNEVASKDNVRKFVDGIGDGNPLWRDETYAVGTRFGGLVAPPTFLLSVLTPSGLLAGGLPGVHSLHGGMAWTFERPIHRDERITVQARLLGVEEKTSRSGGTSVVQTVGVEYLNARGQRLATAKGWSVRLDRSAMRSTRPWGEYTPYPYTAEDYARIEDAYDVEQPRGSNVRYWEQTSVGEELPAIVRGPLGREDVEFYLAGVRRFPCFGSLVADTVRHPAAYYTNPAHDIKEPVVETILFDHVARDVGLPRAHEAAGQRVAWLGSLLSNWIGDDGFLTQLDVRCTRLNLFGDTQWCGGRVTGKRVVGGEHLVDLDVWCENQRGEITATGSAQVRLMSLEV